MGLLEQGELQMPTEDLWVMLDEALEKAPKAARKRWCAHAEHFIKVVDKNGDKKLVWEEVAAWLRARGEHESKIRAGKKYFNMIDQNGNGKVTRKELIGWFEKMYNARHKK